MPDKKLICKDCQKEFNFTESEQKKYALEKWDPPKRCPACRGTRSKNTTLPSPGAKIAKTEVLQQNKAILEKQGHAVPKTTIAPGKTAADNSGKGYFDQSGLMRRALFSDEALKIASQLNARNTTATRLRSFYNKLAAISYQLDQTGDFNSARVKLASFQAVVAYAKERKVVPQEFQDFIERNLSLAEQSPEAFAAFLEHYKSVIAYSKTEKNFLAADWIDGRGLPPGYLKGGYYDANGYLRRETIIEWPKAIVEVFARTSLTSTALRRFYNKLKGLDTSFKFSRDFNSLLPELYAFERDAAYAATRLVVPGEFIGFTVKNIDLAVGNEKGFQGFVEHFQSIVAFAKGKLKEGGRGE